MFSSCREGSVSIHRDPSRPSKPFVVRWRKTAANGSSASLLKEDALRFEQLLAPAGSRVSEPEDELAALRAQLARLEARMSPYAGEPEEPSRSGGGVYAYPTRSGTR